MPQSLYALPDPIPPRLPERNKLEPSHDLVHTIRRRPVANSVTHEHKNGPPSADLDADLALYVFRSYILPCSDDSLRIELFNLRKKRRHYHGTALLQLVKILPASIRHPYHPETNL